jgi:hypothetical protein
MLRTEDSQKVDRLATGRRHVRAGSVSVTELISKQEARPEAGADPGPEADAPVPVDVPAEPESGPTSHRRPTSRGAQLAKITSLGVATIVLCGAVGIASMIARQRQENASSADEPAARISGERALLPDELDRSLTPDGAVAVAPPEPDPATRPPTQARTATAQAEPTTKDRTSTSADSPPVPAPVSDLDLVRKFYEHLPSDPAVAFGLISPDLLHSTLGQFLDSWSLVRSVDVLGLRQEANGVLAVVRMTLSGGGHLQLQQLLTVAESPRRIVGVELLSAQRN